MTAHNIESGGERVGKAPFSGPAFRATLERPRSVSRRFGAARPSFSRRNERGGIEWGDDEPRGVDWRFVAFAIGWTAVMAFLFHIALSGGL